MQVEMKTFKESLVVKITESIKKQCQPPQYTVVEVGSSSTGLSMHWSDIDLMVKQTDDSAKRIPLGAGMPPVRLSLENTFKQLQTESSACPWMLNVSYLNRANQPIVSVTCSLKQFMIHQELKYPKNLKYEALYDRTINVNITEFESAA